MAYTTNTLSALSYEIGGRGRVWIYNTSDALTSVFASGYISDAGKKRLMLGDMVIVYSATLNTNLTATPTNVAVGAVSEFAAAPSITICVVSAISALDTRGVPTVAATATLSVAVPTASGQSVFPRNMVIGGDFTVNPWQRGTTFSAIANTVTYTADRFFLVGNDAGVSAKAAKVAFSSVAGFSQAFRFGRTANGSSLSAITAGQILETADSIRAQSQQVTLSFWAQSEANFSAASSLVGVAVCQGNGTDQSAASAVAGTWTGFTNVVSSTQALTSTMTRYSFTGTVSSTTTQLGVLLSYTPVGSAGAADSVLIEGVQLETGPGPSAFEHTDVEMVVAQCQRYAFVLNEPVSGIGVATAVSTASNKFAMVIPMPTPMRVAPTVVVANGSFGFQFANAYLAGSSLTATAVAAGHTQYALQITQLATAASNNAAIFVGGSGTGSIIASAEY